ncbi:hypothetical protein QR680_001193 [Steinernema hermaphroditum]|uniref:Nucleolar complex protein 2 homolog n=1 Tax=Steinernema hermaphroditum TaxID=289476 RepID=A0AA39GY24_9BILA|nr:hypothetical protein QR680_001193 [Steinernema hermaphroditum]
MKTKATKLRKKSACPPPDEDGKSHREELMKIVENDPEFMEFLKENDADLLGNDFIEDEDEFEKEPEVETTVVAGGKLRIRKDQDGRSIVDDDLVDFIEDHIKVDSGSGELKAQERVVRLAVKCFIACVARVGAKMDSPQFVVESQQVFERVVRLCFQQLTGCLYTLLGKVKADENPKPDKTENADEVDDEQEDDEPEDQSDEDYDKQVQAHEPLATESFKNWKKYSAVVKQYLHHLTMFVDELRHDDVIFATVKTIEQVAEIYIHFKILRKRVLKSLIRLWSQKSEKCRLIAFVAMSRFCKLSDSLIPFVLKSCYVSYISNSRVVTPDTLPLISLMQRTYAELAMIRPSITYPYMFVYIRQCAIHVRNAMIAKRKDMVQTVYNWQFIQSLYLWCEVICKASKYHGHEKDYRSVEELAFPFTQVVTATMRLFPSAKFLPLRLHCIRMFVQLQKYCDIFIPALYYCAELLDDVLEMTTKTPKTKNGNFADILCLLKASDAMLSDAVYRKAVSDDLHGQMLKSAYHMATHSGFPDVIVPFDAKIRAFIKKCRSPMDKVQFKYLLNTLRTHAEHVRMVILAKQVDLNEESSLNGIHFALKLNSPLITFYNNWTKQIEAQRDALEIAEKSAQEETKRMEKRRAKAKK